MIFRQTSSPNLTKWRHLAGADCTEAGKPRWGWGATKCIVYICNTLPSKSPDGRGNYGGLAPPEPKHCFVQKPMCTLPFEHCLSFNIYMNRRTQLAQPRPNTTLSPRARILCQTCQSGHQHVTEAPVCAAIWNNTKIPPKPDKARVQV